ncbi:unnamed protein product [Linum tenue]|uniref:Transposase (putative) gypsy type domain-containing protein n=3 Tax=Linum tenue TaxID=586396 RepID=A0AAV0L3P9_9ROSI|nr:unnamed protein product [Linum tenue]
MIIPPSTVVGARVSDASGSRNIAPNPLGFNVCPWEVMYPLGRVPPEYPIGGLGRGFTQSEKWLRELLVSYGMPHHWSYAIPNRLVSAVSHPSSWRSVFRSSLEYGFRLPLPTWLCVVMHRSKLSIDSVSPRFWTFIACFILSCRRVGVPPSPELFYACFFFRHDRVAWELHKRKSANNLCTSLSHLKGSWETEFFYFLAPLSEFTSGGITVPADWSEGVTGGFQDPVIEGEIALQHDRLLRERPIDISTPGARASLFLAVYGKDYSHFQRCMRNREVPAVPHSYVGVSIRERPDNPPRGRSRVRHDQSKRTRSWVRGSGDSPTRKGRSEGRARDAKGKTPVGGRGILKHQGESSGANKGGILAGGVITYDSLCDAGKHYPVLEDVATGSTFASSISKLARYAVAMECRLAMAELRVTEAREEATRSLDEMRIQMKTREEQFSSKSCEWDADMVEAQQHVEAATQELRTSEAAEASLREKVEQLHASMREERLIRRSLRSENTGLHSENTTLRSENNTLRHQLQMAISGVMDNVHRLARRAIYCMYPARDIDDTRLRQVVEECATTLEPEEVTSQNMNVVEECAGAPQSGEAASQISNVEIEFHRVSPLLDVVSEAPPMVGTPVHSDFNISTAMLLAATELLGPEFFED